jgi:hypothetical protein
MQLLVNKKCKNIAAPIAQATGNPATARQIEQVISLYSPITVLVDLLVAVLDPRIKF